MKPIYEAVGVFLIVILAIVLITGMPATSEEWGAATAKAIIPAAIIYLMSAQQKKTEAQS